MTPEEFLERNEFVTATEIDRSALITALLSEMEKGLAGEASSLLMIPSYLGAFGKIPEGASAMALDAGGTHFRAGIVSTPAEVRERSDRPMPGSLSEVSTDEFYRSFVEEVRRLQSMTGGDRLGWCFSYPAESTPELDAKLVRWTKNIKAPEIVGHYVGRELAKRAGLSRVVVVNDTVATLLAVKAVEGDTDYSSYIGFVLGTGTNVAYVERRANILKDPAISATDGTMIINAESGGFDKLPLSTFDRTVDERSGNPGYNLLEKQIAGAYLGPIGLEILKGAAKAGLFDGRAANLIGGLGELGAVELNHPERIFEDEGDVRMARRLLVPVLERAATLSAVHLAAFAIKSGEGAEASSPIAINIDGSTYYKTDLISFADCIRRELDDMLVRRRNINYTIVPAIADASLIGAAIATLL